MACTRNKGKNQSSQTKQYLIKFLKYINNNMGYMFRLTSSHLQALIGEVFGNFTLAYLGNAFLTRHCFSKYMLAQHFSRLDLTFL